jgi:hypothetical protein
MSNSVDIGIDFDPQVRTNVLVHQGASNHTMCYVFSSGSDSSVEWPYVRADIAVHQAMLVACGSDSSAEPLYYVRSPMPAIYAADSSSQNVRSMFADDYQKVERQLDKLLNAAGDERVVEEGAVRSAMTVLKHLKYRQYAPPKLTWHGGDAVVMLWALASTVYAFTVTDGEIGYVVRRGQHAVAMDDSISINALSLANQIEHVR